MDAAKTFRDMYERRFKEHEERDGRLYIEGLGCDLMTIRFTNGSENSDMDILGDGLSCFYPPQGLRVVQLILDEMDKEYSIRSGIIRKLTLGDGAKLNDFYAGHKTDQGNPGDCKERP